MGHLPEMVLKSLQDFRQLHSDIDRSCLAQLNFP